MAKATQTQLSNPFSTGGGGVNFETRIQASFAVLMLAGGYSPCVRGWPIKAIHLQAKRLGFETDDLVVEAEEAGSARKSRLLAQIKHDISFTAGNKTFQEVISATWKDFSSKIDTDFDAIALITGPLSGADLDLRAVLEWARTSNGADDFFSKVNRSKFSSKNKQKKLAATMQHLRLANSGKVSNEETWQFLKRFHILQYDLDIASGVNRAFLSCIISQFGTARADGTWTQLVDAVSYFNQSAGTLTADTLPQELVEAFQRRPTSVISKDLLQASLVTSYAPVTTKVSYELAVAQFVGAWRESSRQDRSYLSQLAGESYEEFVRKLSVELNTPGAAIRHKNGVWSVAERAECWSAFGSYLFDRHLELLQEHAQSAFSEDKTEFLTAEDDSITANSDTLYSDQLRAALADTLALVATAGSSLKHCRTDLVGSIPTRVVRTCLREAGWIRLASLDDLLPVLAEAAPEAFLEAIEKAVRKPETLKQLFALERGAFFGRPYITGLLWGLENLAWSPEFLGRVTLVLGALHEQDPGGQWANRPLESLKSIFLPWLPQTTASPERRLAALEALRREHPDVAWEVYVAALPRVTQSTSGTHRPKWRPFATREPPEITRGQYADAVNSYSASLLQIAEADTKKLVSLTQHLGNLPPTAFRAAINVIYANVDQLRRDKQDNVIWNKLQEITRKHTAFASSDWAMSPDLVAEIGSLSERFKPSDPAVLYKEIFGAQDITFYDREISWEQRQQRLYSLQREAVEHVWQAAGFEGVRSFARSVSRPRAVGYALGQLAPDVPATALSETASSTNGSDQEFVVGYVAAKFGAEKEAWLETLALDTWNPRSIAQVLVGLPFKMRTWQLVEELLPSSGKLYWKTVAVQPIDDDDALHFVVQHLLDNGRPISAIDAIHMFLFRHKRIDVDDACRALLAVGQGSEKPSQLDGYEIESIIKYLQESTQTDPARLQAVEWAYLELLERPGCQTFPRALEQHLADKPDFFLQVISSAYRAEGAPAKEPSETEKRVALNAYRVLSGWRIPPGQAEDGGFDGNRFEQWIKVAVSSARKSGHLGVAMQQLGSVLRNVPADADGFWIDRKVAEALNDADLDQLRSGYRIGLFNSRGVHWVDPSGSPERELSQKYSEKAEQAELAGYVRLAACLRGLSKEYDAHADMIVATDGFSED
ncbi:MAG: hypothetical protein EOS25_13320 [Mesorhizobium sp.]|uniref:hypothetical protein n=1 Tax=Mesorhizobium sp. TaxID=1871066 RepID=UPI000FE55A3F|nr:hypothetical protein [Mesorhizobium sp.]RWD45169.1 MAG: hypothetical protein EOS59_22065 [Mesorhizobium sp.]RWE52719.1 MAG: hypothetical protein EOS24_29170 [Mesorhizobium sp.]RWF07407.1 MAG: hypothetical protein EOS69_28840 [Mesorhizobium sp.]RWF18640.1 MAG: hypothetical protein EOS25_13320 [Mesorhizobium sp.]TIW49983.1 MAG: hypothetical protein E5V71_00045 [Mesorhizobium sp.]